MNGEKLCAKGKESSGNTLRVIQSVYRRHFCFRVSATYITLGNTLPRRKKPLWNKDQYKIRILYEYEIVIF